MLLRERSFEYPEVTEDFPWGHRALKVKGKAFIFIANEKAKDELSLSVKLPQTGGEALTMPFAAPTGYGMGKHGWVTATFRKGDDIPVEVLYAWLDESFRAVAPKKLAAKVAPRA
jgi:predicted DNA-binding protein (MmcQ/YjbR family)